jgi:hypothetical protein
MSYDFSFSGKSISLVVGGAAFVGVMLFIAGLLVGTSWNAEPGASDKVAGKQPVAVAPTPAPTTAPAAPEPVVTADAATPEAAAPAGAGDAPGGASLPVKQAHGNAASVNRGRASVPTPTPPNDGELRVVQEAEPAPAEGNKPPAF